MAKDLDHVWKALADPTRRKILDLLRDGPRQTTHIVESFPQLSRFGVMKHLDVLRDAGLVNTREHLESLFEALERGVPSVQHYLKGGGGQRRVA